MVEDDVAHGAPMPSTPGGPCLPTLGPTLSAGTSGCGPPRPRGERICRQTSTCARPTAPASRLVTLASSSRSMEHVGRADRLPEVDDGGGRFRRQRPRPPTRLAIQRSLNRTCSRGRAGKTCPDQIAACVAAGGRRPVCKRQTLRRCTREGLAVCWGPGAGGNTRSEPARFFVPTQLTATTVRSRTSSPVGAHSPVRATWARATLRTELNVLVAKCVG